MTWFSKKHLDDAAEIAEIRTTNKIHKYYKRSWNVVFTGTWQCNSRIFSLDLEFQAVRMENCYVKKS